MPWTPLFDPTTFAATDRTSSASVCLRCGAAVIRTAWDGTEDAVRRHHDWHLALDTAIAHAGAPYGSLAELSKVRSHV